MIRNLVGEDKFKNTFVQKLFLNFVDYDKS